MIFSPSQLRSQFSKRTVHKKTNIFQIFSSLKYIYIKVKTPVLKNLTTRTVSAERIVIEDLLESVKRLQVVKIAKNENKIQL